MMGTEGGAPHALEILGRRQLRVRIGKRRRVTLVGYLLARRPGGQRVQHVLDADAQAPQAGAPAAPARIDRDAAPFAQRLSPERATRAVSASL